MARLRPGSLVYFLIFAVVGALFAAIGSVILFSSVRERSLCTVNVPAKVIRMESRRSSGKRGTSISYAPVVEYTYNGETYVFISSVSSNPPKYHAGESVEVMINPDEPVTAYIAGDSSLYLLCGICIAVGLISIVIGGVSVIKVNR